MHIECMVRPHIEVEGLRARVARFVGGLTKVYTTMFARQPKYTVVSGRRPRMRFLQLSHSCSVHPVAVLGLKDTVSLPCEAVLAGIY